MSQAELRELSDALKECPTEASFDMTFRQIMEDRDETDRH